MSRHACELSEAGLKGLRLTPIEQRLVRALRSGGCAMRDGDAWCVRRGPDRRARSIGRLSGERVAALRAHGLLTNIDDNPERLGWAGDASPLMASVARPAPLPRKATRRGLVAQVLDPKLDCAPRRQAAVSRLLSDLERSATPVGMTMSWDASGVRNAPWATSGGPGTSCGEALGRMRALSEALGGEVVRALVVALVDRAPAVRFAQLLGIDRKASAKILGDMIDDLAEAYDLKAPPERR